MIYFIVNVTWLCIGSCANDIERNSKCYKEWKMSRFPHLLWYSLWNEKTRNQLKDSSLLLYYYQSETKKLRKTLTN